MIVVIALIKISIIQTNRLFKRIAYFPAKPMPTTPKGLNVNSHRWNRWNCRVGRNFVTTHRSVEMVGFHFIPTHQFGGSILWISSFANNWVLKKRWGEAFRAHGEKVLFCVCINCTQGGYMDTQQFFYIASPHNDMCIYMCVWEENWLACNGAKLA